MMYFRQPKSLKQEPKLNRFRSIEVDQDLAYITDRCIAMCAPGFGTAAKCLNTVNNTRSFFVRQYESRFLIFNLCKEQNYDKDIFDGRVLRIPVQEHSPPAMEQILVFLEQAAHFMQEHPSNCMAVHSSEGKGRTGTMISAWLMYTRMRGEGSADAAMEWFERARSGKRIYSRPRTIHSPSFLQPSQQRYVRYMESVLANGGYRSPPLLLTRVALRGCLLAAADPAGLYLAIHAQGQTVYEHDWPTSHHAGGGGGGDGELILDLRLPVCGDVRVSLCERGAARAAPAPIMCGLGRARPPADEIRAFVCIHTGFALPAALPAAPPADAAAAADAAAGGGGHHTLVFGKGDVDLACGDVTCVAFADGFAVELRLAPAADGGAGAGGAGGALRRLREPSPTLLANLRQEDGRDWDE